MFKTQLCQSTIFCLFFKVKICLYNYITHLKHWSTCKTMVKNTYIIFKLPFSFPAIILIKNKQEHFFYVYCDFEPPTNNLFYSLTSNNPHCFVMSWWVNNSFVQLHNRSWLATQYKFYNRYFTWIVHTKTTHIQLSKS